MDTVPPVADKVTATAVVLPSLILPWAVNCWVALAATVAVPGVSTTEDSAVVGHRDRAGIGLGPPLLHRDHPVGTRRAPRGVQASWS